jgi:hypothetical protein
MYYTPKCNCQLELSCCLSSNWEQGKAEQRFKKLGVDTAQNDDERLHFLHMSEI